ncbi:MAG: class I SAM-dependent methyltransferase [Verrucomicrobiia bacterium]
MNGLILFDDEHLLVVNKPSGINTHKPDRYAPDGIHEWFCKRFGGRGSGRAEAQRDSQAARADSRPPAPLSILHRLDKETSGVLLFGRTLRANQSLSRQFESHQIEKEYLLLSSARPTRAKFRARSADAVTEFAFVQPHGRFFLIEARPITGKMHQIRRHAAENAFPIVGDTKYGGEPAPRLMLHAHKLTFEHPTRGEKMTMEASVPVAFEELDALAAAKEFRDLIFDEDTNAFRLISGAADGFPDVIVDSYAGNLLVQWQTEAAAKTGPALLEQLKQRCGGQAIYEQLVTKRKRTVPGLTGCGGASMKRRGENEAALNRRLAEAPLQRFSIRENGLNFLISLGEGLSTGIFLDQRENRRRLLMANLAGKTLLNCFAYTCAFSVAAAKAGAVTTSIDLSRHYLEWGKDNFRANDLHPEAHRFLVGDVLEWLKRFQKRGQDWDIVVLDPPTFSTTKKGRAFQAERDYEELEALAIALVARGGTLFCSTNQRTLAPDKFEGSLREAARQTGRVIASVEFETLPFDFRVAEGERPYLKTLWARLD